MWFYWMSIAAGVHEQAATTFGNFVDCSGGTVAITVNQVIGVHRFRLDW